MECLTPAMIGTMRLKNRFIFPSMCNFTATPRAL